MVKDSEKYCICFDKLFNKLEKYYPYNFEFFIYENDSLDLTKLCLYKFMKQRQGLLISENSCNIKKNMEGISKSRGVHMCNIRNKLKKYHGTLDSTYTLLLDSDVIFHEKTLEKMLEVFENNKDIAMVTPYGICYTAYKKWACENHYYDSFAVQTINKAITWENNNNACMFAQCKVCCIKRQLNNNNIDKSHLFKMDTDLEYVDSAFGGFCLIKTSVYNKVKWENTICEHHGFCENVRQFGKIVIAKKIKTYTTTPEYSNSKEYDKIIVLLKNYY
tara:strand:+ start:1856 stop:2680 length:825 start_codon:yes stop_codon:yes gene_type:complete